MRINLRFIALTFIAFSIVSCGRFEPFNDKISSNSDGSYVIESSLSDREMIENGLIVVYRFKSVPNLIAVRQSDTNLPKKNSVFFAHNLARLIKQNTKNRPIFSNFYTKNISSDICFSPYCEAEFDKAENLIHQNSLTLNPVQIAVIDSGVLASTNPIKKILFSSSNITRDTNINDWLPHATMITSLFAGVVDQNVSGSTPSDIYAPNAQVHSIKITFSGDPDTSVQQLYGSMQLAVALDEAVAKGAKIVNLSLTYDEKPDENIAFAEQGIMAAAAQKGVFFVAAAGNESLNIDKNPIYPAAYNTNNLIVIGSHTSTLQKARSSNYGKIVDLSAQGAAITVNDKSGRLNMAGGTSFAAPLVVSALSLYLGARNNITNLSVNDVLNDLFNSSSNYYNVDSNDQISNYGRLNTRKFLEFGINYRP